ncbi:hypothetical protein HII36_23165 [Nonomuraea sp. NN258]|uniref:hypothetical protein n=1 Tax=Nonomuraea antri TaxID=2730852 RepID=UPI00156933A6|nr:hypothetical protein [Nonomuraea antri]NRQ34710.1 hypothetical protein [Nonomuraea antri]
MRAEIMLSSPIKRSARVLQLQGLFDVPISEKLAGRQSWVARDIQFTIGQYNPVLVVVNKPAEQAAATAWDATDLWWHIVKDLIGDMRPIAVTDDTAFTYASGIDRACGPEVYERGVLAALAQRYDQERGLTAGKAAALVRVAMGAGHLGHPIVLVPARHCAALDHVDRWHEVWH